MIDTKSFEYAASRWQDLYLFLKDKGYDVYAPGVKVGECTSPYLVVKNNGLADVVEFSSKQELYSVIVYVPKQQYSTLEVLVTQVETDMKEIAPLFKPRNVHTPSYYDDDIKAHSISLEYSNYRRDVLI